MPAPSGILVIESVRFPFNRGVGEEGTVGVRSRFSGLQGPICLGFLRGIVVLIEIVSNRPGGSPFNFPTLLC